MRVFAIEGVAVSRETLSSITSSTGFTSSKIAPTTGDYAGKRARAAIIAVESAAIRFMLDGDAVTVTGGASPGFILYDGDSYIITGEANVAGFRCINEAAGNGAVVRAQFLF